MKHTHNQCVENDQTRTLDARSCSFFRKIVYKYPFLQRSIEKWKIEARLCVTLVDLLFYASFSPVCLCLATISVSILRRVFSPLVFYFLNLFFFLFFIVSWNEWSNGVACLDVVVLFFFFYEVYVFIESKAMEERLVKIEFPFLKFIGSFGWCFTFVLSISVISTNKYEEWSWIFIEGYRNMLQLWIWL